MSIQSRMDLTNPSPTLPGGVLSALQGLPGRFIVRGHGGRCWDQFDQTYIDYICGYGPIIIGHCNAEVNQAVIQQLELGIIFPSYTTLHYQLNATLKRIFPYTDCCLFMKTGSEAISAAIRLARAFTGRATIFRCGFHGWHDAFISPYTSWHLFEADPFPPRYIPGIPQDPTAALVVSWDGEDFQQLADLFQAHRPSVAALILDPIQLREPFEENLRQLRKLTEEEGALLILDEIKTGFRVSLNGVQGLYNIKPDITVLSKAISNGFPLAVVLGQPKIMGLIQSARIMGTYNNELVSIAAALKTISILERSGSITRLWELGQKLIDGTNEILNRYRLIEDIQAVAYRWPCMPALWFHQHSERAQNLKSSLINELARHGVLILANHPSFICLEHNKQDVDDTLAAMDAAVLSCLTTINNQ
ncbi:MAG: aminotransferase class III-fold pyridoxal phosphate-dependent enzyme [Chloroflexi bacterium]|nr:aminotransferase class III-fold pyridoxal phosphate-dependent enzyme [Chloroflexota bacterium]